MRRNSPTLIISGGNKVIGILSFIATTVLLALFFVWLNFVWEILPFFGLALLLYAFQASKLNYIRFSGGQFIIGNVFKQTIRKEASLFVGVYELFPLTPLMQIKFKDGSSYNFLATSATLAAKLDRSIREAIEGPA
jgi:signal transduction histidine kinase